MKHDGPRFPLKTLKVCCKEWAHLWSIYIPVLIFEYCSVISGKFARRTGILKILSCFGQVHMHDAKHDLYNICLVFKDFIAFAALVFKLIFMGSTVSTTEQRWPSLGKSHPRGVTGLFTGWVGWEEWTCFNKNMGIALGTKCWVVLPNSGKWGFRSGSPDLKI